MARKEVYDTGKPIWEARADVQTAIDALEYYSGLAPTIAGEIHLYVEVLWSMLLHIPESFFNYIFKEAVFMQKNNYL